MEVRLQLDDVDCVHKSTCDINNFIIQVVDDLRDLVGTFPFRMELPHPDGRYFTQVEDEVVNFELRTLVKLVNRCGCLYCLLRGLNLLLQLA